MTLTQPVSLDSKTAGILQAAGITTTTGGPQAAYFTSPVAKVKKPGEEAAAFTAYNGPNIGQMLSTGNINPQVT